MLLERINLEEDERVIEIVRKHWWVIFIRTASIIFLTLLPFLVFFTFRLLLAQTPELGLAIAVGYLADYNAELWFLYTGWLLLLWISLANFWTDHYLDLWAITTKRVVLVDQRGFFNRFVSSFRLERLQDMNIRVKGVLPTLLDFGTIEAQTAGGSNEKFASPNMPKPRDIKATVIRAAEARLAEDRRGEVDNVTGL